MLNFLIKPASGLCNMRCKYCFYHDETEKREVAFKGVMSETTARNLIEKAFESAPSDGVLFAFQGGEPTLAGLGFFEKFIGIVKSRPRRAKAYYSLQTNGINITDEWARFLAENGFLVGLSLDGDEFLHDMNRVDATGNGTYRAVIRAAELFRKHKTEFNILTVVTKAVADNIEKVYREFAKRGFGYLQFIPCLDPLDNDEAPEYALSNDDYFKFSDKLFKLWYADLKKGIYTSIRYFDNLYFMYRGGGAEQCGMQGHCNLQFVIEGNGDVYPCDFYCLDEYILGNINTDSLADLVKTSAAKKFLHDSSGFDAECRHCDAFPLCKSGCRRYKGRDGKYIYCKAFKHFHSRIKHELANVERIVSEGKLKMR